MKVIELNREKLHNLEGHTWTREENVMIKTRVLLIRSCLSTLGALTTDLSGFFHPYLPKVLQILLPLMSSKHFPDSAVLVNDTNSYLSTLIKSIPKRLCIPALVQVTPILFSLGHDVSYHYCRFLQQLWLSLERNDVVNHLMSLQSICLYGFQYREMYEGKKEAISSSLNVDEAICESIIEICLKYTEKELKNYLLQLYHWTEENIDETKTNDEGEEEEEEGRKEWLRYCRCKIFFQFVSELEKKLQNIFVPLMGIIWEYASEQILKYLQFIQQHPRSQLSLNDEVDENSKKTKKRKRSTTATTTTTTISVDNTGMNSHKYQLIRNELHETSIWILESVRLCCIHDNIHFIDQVPPLPLPLDYYRSIFD